MKRKIMLLVILVVLAAIFGALTLISSNRNAKTITEAIDAIGEVEFTPESRALIDAADEAIARTDKNLRLEDKVENISALTDAKVKYVEKAIIRLYRAYRDKTKGDDSISDEALLEYIRDARGAFDLYFTESDASLIHNYKDLTDIESKYAGELAPASSPFDAPKLDNPAEEIELC